MDTRLVLQERNQRACAAAKQRPWIWRYCAVDLISLRQRCYTFIGYKSYHKNERARQRTPLGNPQLMNHLELRLVATIQSAKNRMLPESHLLGKVDLPFSRQPDCIGH